MTHVSYCTTCKGRLWQLKQTLPVNLESMIDGEDIVLLDYHSKDGLEDYIKTNYLEELACGKLKYYKLLTPVDGFDMAYAKHIVHMLADGNKLFNLDADNFIGTSREEIWRLPKNILLVSFKMPGTATSRGGRIGVNKADYNRIGGYNCRMLGMTGDDGNFVERAIRQGLRLTTTKDRSIPIQQTDEYKQIHVIKRPEGFRHLTSVTVLDHLNQQRVVRLDLQGTAI